MTTPPTNHSNRADKVEGPALLVILSSPSGGGKTTIIRHLLATGDDRYRRSISVTTRPQRSHEINGRDYHFVSPANFQQMIERQELLEYEKVHNDYYGTPKRPVEEWIEEGKIIFFDIDVKGALSLRKFYPDRTLLIFIQPPSMEILKQRLLARKSETEEQVQKRLERAAMEMAYASSFDYIVVNDELPRAIAEVKSLIDKKWEQLCHKERC